MKKQITTYKIFGILIVFILIFVLLLFNYSHKIDNFSSLSKNIVATNILKSNLLDKKFYTVNEVEPQLNNIYKY